MSFAAQSVFTRAGSVAFRSQTVELCGEKLINIVMEKGLEPV